MYGVWGAAVRVARRRARKIEEKRDRERKREKEREGEGEREREREREEGRRAIYIAEGKSGKGSCGCESVLSRGETINFAGIHVDRREDELTSTIDGLCWPTVSHPLLPLPRYNLLRVVSSSSPRLCCPHPSRDVPSRRRRIWYNETAFADAFRAVSAAETCSGNGDFNTDVPGYQSQPLSGTSYPTPSFDPRCSNYNRSVLRDTIVYDAWWRRGDAGGMWGISRVKEQASRGKLYRRRTQYYGYGWDFRRIFGKMRQRAPRPVGSSSWIVHQSGKPSVERFLAEIRFRRSLRYSGADFVMEKSCYSILINNGGRARYGGENFKR